MSEIEYPRGGVREHEAGTGQGEERTYRNANDQGVIKQKHSETSLFLFMQT